MSLKLFVMHLSGARPERITPDLLSTHLEYLRRLRVQGTLVLSGPCEDGTALVILRCNDRREVDRVIADDPFTPAGIFGECEVVGFTQAVPTPQSSA
jgi:uncharacterized protein YciI